VRLAALVLVTLVRLRVIAEQVIVGVEDAVVELLGLAEAVQDEQSAGQRATQNDEPVLHVGHLSACCSGPEVISARTAAGFKRLVDGVAGGAGLHYYAAVYWIAGKAASEPRNGL
jgi:hypothetical protein